MTTKFNINQYVSVKLTNRGRQIHRNQYDELMLSAGKELFPYHPPLEDAEGWSTWQMHNLIETFGAHVLMGADLPFETEILIHLPKTVTLTEEDT